VIERRETPPRVARSRETVREGGLREISGPAPTLTLVTVALLGVWMGCSYGGYFVQTWAPVALLLCAPAVVWALPGASPGGVPRRAVGALVLFSGYAVWTFASILWSPNKGDAWAGAGQTFLYLVAFALAVRSTAAGASRRRMLAAWVLGTSAVAGLTLLALGSGAGDMFRRHRLIGTVGYHNAEAAFLLMPFWAAIYLSASRSAHPALRGAAQGGAVLCASVAVLAQSRGAMVAMALSLPVFFLFSGGRLRGLVALAPVAVALLAVFPDLNHVYVALSDGATPSGALGGVACRVWATSGAAGLYGLAWAVVDLRWRPTPSTVRVAGGVAVACVLLLAVLGMVAFHERAGEPVAWGEGRWEAFKTDDQTGQAQSRYLSAAGSGRYVLWEVASRDFAEHPLLGVGTQNYEATYYRLREDTVGWARQPHSLPLEILAERGAVGGVLFAGFLLACLRGGLRRRPPDPEAGMQAGALVSAACYWLVHSGVDWFWQMPAVTLPAIAALALLAVPQQEQLVAHAGRTLRLYLAGIAVLVAVAIASLYVADTYLRQSYAAGGTHEALVAVERSMTFDPLDPRASGREAEVAARAGYDDRAEAAYRRQIRSNPRHFAPYSLFGDFRRSRGGRAEALALYERALELNPLDENLNRAVDELREPGPGR
jgi:tetratricopeptide (TPR) repeat protein